MFSQRLLSQALLLTWLAVDAASYQPIHGSDWESTFNCPAVQYPAKSKTCHDARCGTGAICSSCDWGPHRSIIASCCPQGQLPPPGRKGRYPCQRQHISSGGQMMCQWRCCSSPLAVPCITGCCKAGDHGQQHKCGRTPKTHKFCCIEETASPEDQLQAGCCIEGDGVLCASGPQQLVACCLWTGGDHWNKTDPDPHSPCQPKDCSRYQPCPRGEGYDCNFHGQRVCCLRSRLGRIAEEDPCQRAKEDCNGRWRKCRRGVGTNCAKDGEACCLSEDLYISEADPCQLSPSDCRSRWQRCRRGVGANCENASAACCLSDSGKVSEEDPCQQLPGDCQSRWRHCPNGVGSNCAKGGEACCLSEVDCWPDCSHYSPPAELPPARIAVIVSCILIVCCLTMCAAYRRCRRRSTTRRPPALVLANSGYRGCFTPLPFALNDGVAMARMLDELGYEVIHDWDVTRDKMMMRCRQLVDRLGGSSGTLVPIYFAGHGVEVAGVRHLVPVDATEYNPESFVPFAEFIQLPKRAHLPRVASSPGCEPVRSAVFACFFDACRSPVPPDRRQYFSAAVAQFPMRRSIRRQGDACHLFVLDACQDGGVAQEAHGHGRFTKAVLDVHTQAKSEGREATLQDFEQGVRERVWMETAAARERDPSVELQQPCVYKEHAWLDSMTLAHRMPSASSTSEQSRRSSSSLLQGRRWCCSRRS